MLWLQRRIMLIVRQNREGEVKSEVKKAFSVFTDSIYHDGECTSGVCNRGKKCSCQ